MTYQLSGNLNARIWFTVHALRNVCVRSPSVDSGLPFLYFQQNTLKNDGVTVAKYLLANVINSLPSTIAIRY